MIRVVYEDDDLIAVDKPEGVACHAADPAHPDDLPHRLKLERGLDYLGVHRRLDKDLSGVLVYAKRRRANKSLAEQFEGCSADERYVALVDGRVRDGTLEHHLARGRDGRTDVVPKRDRRGKRALTHVRTIRRAGPRSLLELRVELGRSHQIRAQLAAVSAPVVGDGLYGGAAGPRLMLHSRFIALRHPVTGAELRIDAPEPRLFAALLEPTFAPYDHLTEALEQAAERRWGLAHRDDVDAYRLVHGAADGLPGIAVDVYGEWRVVHVYDEDAPLERVLDGLDARGIYLKRRPKQANEIAPATDILAPRNPVRGEAAPDPLVILEHGVPYLVRLGDGLSTGIFLDQRENRRRVGELAGARRVLNLFSYTGAFTVAAAVGGARETLSVDVSKRQLARGRENLANAGVEEGTRHRFEARDCFDALRALAGRDERFDLVIVDPPTYSTTKSTRWKSGKGWSELARLALSVVAPGGTLLACNNDQRMSLGRFRRHLSDAVREADVEPVQLEDVPCPPDFRAAPGQEAHQKTLLATRA